MDIFASIFADGISVGTFFAMFGIALIMGIVVAYFSKYKSNSSKGFFITISTLLSIFLK